MTVDLPALHPGDEVLIRARVVKSMRPEQLLVELFSKTDQYQAWVRCDLVEQVIPAAETRTFKGFTVAETIAAIADVSAIIADREHGGGDSPAERLALDSLRASRAELVGQLREIGVVEAES